MDELPADNKPGYNSSDPERFYCEGCSHTDQCRQIWSQPARGELTSAGISLASATVFLLPLITAIIAGTVAHCYLPQPGKPPLWQIAAVIAGLITGVLLAWMVMPLIRKRFHAHLPKENNSRP